MKPSQARNQRETTRSEMQEDGAEENQEEEDALPGNARKCSSSKDVIEMRQGKLCGMVMKRKDAVYSPARKGCTPRSAGKIVRRRDLGQKLGNSTVANLKKMFEPNSLTKGLVEGPPQLLPVKLYSGKTSSKVCVSQWEDARQNEPRDILDLGFGKSQDWSEMPGKRCTRPMRMQETGASARTVKKREFSNSVE